jgi:hypothetical protein
MMFCAPAPLNGAHTSEVKVEHRSLPLCFDYLPDATMVIVSGHQSLHKGLTITETRKTASG